MFALQEVYHKELMERNRHICHCRDAKLSFKFMVVAYLLREDHG